MAGSIQGATGTSSRYFGVSRFVKVAAVIAVVCIIFLSLGAIFRILFREILELKKRVYVLEMKEPELNLDALPGERLLSRVRAPPERSPSAREPLQGSQATTVARELTWGGE